MTTSTVDRLATSQALRTAVGRVAHRLRQLWATGEAADGISFSEGALLNHLVREGPSSPTALAGNERVTSQAITAHLAHLEGRGLIRRTPDPHDGRKVVVTITPGGRRTLTAREATVLEHVTVALEGFDETERQTLLAAVPLLSRLSDAL